ncbi:MAG: AMP-binding protein, partial [Deltaproteobacteria bacterium]
GAIHPETSGVPMPWTEVKIAEDGEVLVKSEFMFAGYYRDPESTEAKFKDGFYHSGDFGYINEEGHLIVIDRMEDLKMLSTGEKFSPQYTEVRLRFSPYIKDAIVVGGETRHYVTSLINIDLENVGRFAEANHLSYTTFTDLSQKPQVIELIDEEIRKVNRTLPEHARIKYFVNLHKEFDADEAELTRTRKLRRTFVEDRYRDLIEALYGDRDEIAVEAAVTYRDGRTGVIRTSIRVNKVE